MDLVAYPPPGAMPEEMKEESPLCYSIDEAFAMLEKGPNLAEITRMLSYTKFELAHIPTLLTAIESKDN